ncbi:hypothetical protein [Dialister sp.]|uniref:hypothetical protein n=1 Tax=Dialister sp. TaxID=1955814 RepID=UPI003F002333
MRTMKKAFLSAALLLSFSAAGAVFGTAADAASLEAKAPAGPVSDTGRDYRIALINAERSSGPVIHKPGKKDIREAREDVSRRPDQDSFSESKGGDYRRNQPSDEPSDVRGDRRDGPDHEIRPMDGRPDFHSDQEGKDRDHRFDKHRGPRFDKDGNKENHRFDEHRGPRFDKDGNNENHRFDEHRGPRFDQGRKDRDHRFDKGHDPRYGRDGDHRFDRRHDSNGKGRPVPPPEDAQF